MFSKPIRKQFLSSIPEIPELSEKMTLKNSFVSKGLKSIESYWYVIVAFFGMLLLYGMARIISLQRRVRDLEARPPVDEITLRGAIRLQLNDLVSDLEQNLRAKNTESIPNLKNSQSQFEYKNLNQPESDFSRLNKFDDEINQVFEIANSVKESLPNLKLFANVLKNQKNQKNEKLEIKKVVDSIENVSIENVSTLKDGFNDLESNKKSNFENQNDNDLQVHLKLDKSQEHLQEVYEFKSDLKSNLKDENNSTVESSSMIQLEKEQVDKNEADQVQQEVQVQEVQVQERWSNPLKKKSKALTTTKLKTKKKIINDDELV
jgi:hypothetical protein